MYIIYLPIHLVKVYLNYGTIRKFCSNTLENRPKDTITRNVNICFEYSIVLNLKKLMYVTCSETSDLKISNVCRQTSIF